MKLYGIDQCYPPIFYSEFPIKTLTHNNLNYKQLFDRRHKQKLQKVGYKQTKPANLPIFSTCQCSKSTWRSHLFLEHALLERVQYPYLI